MAQKVIEDTQKEREEAATPDAFHRPVDNWAVEKSC